MAEGMSEDRARAGGRADEAQQHPDGRGLPGAVLAHEAGDRTRRDEEVEAVDGEPLAEALREPTRDHGVRVVGLRTNSQGDLLGRECDRAHPKMKPRIPTHASRGVTGS